MLQKAWCSNEKSVCREYLMCLLDTDRLRQAGIAANPHWRPWPPDRYFSHLFNGQLLDTHRVVRRPAVRDEDSGDEEDRRAHTWQPRVVAITDRAEDGDDQPDFYIEGALAELLHDEGEGSSSSCVASSENEAARSSAMVVGVGARDEQSQALAPSPPQAFRFACLALGSWRSWDRSTFPKWMRPRCTSRILAGKVPSPSEERLAPSAFKRSEQPFLYIEYSSGCTKHVFIMNISATIPVFLF